MDSHITQVEKKYIYITKKDMDASELGSSVGTFEGKLDMLKWDQPKQSRNISFYVCLVIGIISTIVITIQTQTLGSGIFIFCIGCILSFLVAWGIGWLTEYTGAARRARIIQYCNKTPEYIECLKSEKDQKECVHVPEMVACVREQQRIEEQNAKMDRMMNKLDRMERRR